MSDSNGTRRIFQQIPMDSIGFQRIPMDFTGNNMKKSENVGKSRKLMIRLFMIRLWLFPINNFLFIFSRDSFSGTHSQLTDFWAHHAIARAWADACTCLFLDACLLFFGVCACVYVRLSAIQLRSESAIALRKAGGR